MSVLLANTIQSPLAGQVNPHLSSDLQLFEGTVGWPPGEPVDQSPMVNAPLAPAWPVSAAPRFIATEKLLSYVDDFYYRVHITPKRLDLGNVASAQTAQVEVWNAWFEVRTLDVITGLDEGISLSGQADPPLLYSALQARLYDVSIVPEGPSDIDDLVFWTFDNGNVPTLTITGTRIIPWAFLPNWQDAVTERLEWATDILASLSGAEQRRALRLSPRRQFSATILVEGRWRQLLDLSLFSWSGKNWVLPIWKHIQRLPDPVNSTAIRIDCDTADLDFRVGGLAFLRGETPAIVEVAEIEAIDATGLDLVRPLQRDWSAGSRLYPALAARLIEQPALKRHTDEFDELAVNFIVTEPNDWPALLPATTYQGFPVLAERPNESEDLTHSWARMLLELDNGTGIPQITDTAGRAFPVRMHRWLLNGRAEQSAFHSLLYGLQGRFTSVWMPTHASDMTVLADLTDLQVTIDIENIGYARFGLSATGPAPGRRDIAIELGDGTVFYRRIVSGTEVSDDVERLTLDAALGVAVTIQEVRRISWLMLVRLDQDGIDIEHHTDSEGVATSEALFRGVRDDEL